MRPLKATILCLFSLHVWAEDDWKETRGIPRGQLSHIREINGQDQDNAKLKDNIETLKHSMEGTVRSIVSKRNMNCFEDACLVQAFPILYSKRGSGFWGGLKAKITNVSRADVPLWSADIFAQRSDRNDWISHGEFELPEMAFFPLHPSLEFRGGYSRTTSARYYGQGRGSQDNEDRNDDEVRYDLLTYDTAVTLSFDLYRHQHRTFRSFWSYEVKKQSSRPYTDVDKSVLFQDQALGIHSPHSGIAATGIEYNNTNKRYLPSRGASSSLSFAMALPAYASRHHFRRLTLVDQRYLGLSSRLVLAHRLTLDGIFGEAPYWELSAVGGPKPIRNIASSDLLRAYPSGRFHERKKALSALELRWNINPIRFFGERCDVALVPGGINTAYFDKYTAISGFAGTHVLCNNTFLVQAFAGYSTMGLGLELEFGQNF